MSIKCFVMLFIIAVQEWAHHSTIAWANVCVPIYNGVAVRAAGGLAAPLEKNKRPVKRTHSNAHIGGRQKGETNTIHISCGSAERNNVFICVSQSNRTIRML